MAQAERIVIEVSPEELKKALELKDGKTWREFLLIPAGIDTKRRAVTRTISREA